VMTEEAAASLEALGQRLDEEAEPELLDSWYCTTMALFAMESQEKELARTRFDACVEAHPADVSVVVAATDFLIEEKDTDGAIAILERAIELYEGEGDSGLSPKLAELYVSLGRADEAEALLLEALESENLQTSLNYRHLLSQFYESRGQLDDALEQVEQAVGLMRELRAPTLSAEFNLADVAIRAGHIDRALEVAAGLDHPPFRLMIEARVAQEREEHAKAISLYEEAARLWPDNEFARYHAARSAEQLGDFDAAIELYRHTTRITFEATNATARIALLLHASNRSAEAFTLLRTQEARAGLGEIGELLKLEIMVMSNGVEGIPGYLTGLPKTDTIGISPRLARIFRALRLRGEPMKAFELASRVDPRVLVEPGGGRALEELARVAQGQAEALDRVTSMLELAATLDPSSAELQAVRGFLAEQRGESSEAIAAAYAAALELDPNESLALLGRARGVVDDDPKESLALGRRALEADSVDTEQVTILALQLLNAGARTEALELCALVLVRTPYDGIAAQAMAKEALASGDHSDRTLDLARRAARFARSESSMTLLRDTFAARGDEAQADKITARIEMRKKAAEAKTATQPSGSDAG
jgi:tetratricopeptide (TPR) repeat protein